jgi:hypothetical protein
MGNGSGGFDPDCDPYHIGKIAKQENKMILRNGLFLSESVSEGHQDKWADQVSDVVPVLTFEQSFAALERENYRTAFAGFKKLAEQGDASAQYNLGNMYREGKGVPKDEQQAAAWYHKAAEQGVASAQYNLGMMYGKGVGFPKDNQASYFWFLLASAQGHQVAAELCDSYERLLSPEQCATAKSQTRN